MPSSPAEYFQKNAQNNAIRLHISQTIIYSLKLSRDLNILLFDKSVNNFDNFYSIIPRFNKHRYSFR